MTPDGCGSSRAAAKGLENIRNFFPGGCHQSAVPGAFCG
jgi:hypothetical protein